MKRIIVLFTSCLIQFTIFSQLKQVEVGLDGAVHASTIGGNYTYGFKPTFALLNEVAIGPSFRQIHYYSNYNGISGKANIYGFGIFVHYRYLNTLFCGIETEIFKIPYNIQSIQNQTKNWVPTLFLGGGFSKEYKEKIRLNLGVYYDLINNLNSPLRASYVMKNSLNQYIPIIYRFAVYIPIYKSIKKEESSDE